MAIHLMAVAKVPFLHWFKLSPLLWPFNLYFPVARHLPGMCEAISNASSLLAFRLSRILAVGPNDDPRGLTRMERAFRLFCQEVVAGRPSHLPHNVIDETSLHVLHNLAL